MPTQFRFNLIRHILILLLLVLCSCQAYKQDILFQFDEEFTEADLTAVVDEVEANYALRENDVLQLDVFTNDGERLMDPNQEMVTQGNVQVQQQRDVFRYTIQSDGYGMFPLIGRFKVDGMTLFEAEQALAKEFDALYKGSFVKLRISNRRVFVLGVSGGKVIPLENENTKLVEVLALSDGVSFGSKAHNVKLIRGDLVYQVDLSTISGFQRTNMNVEPGDIIYIEPWRRPFFETLKDASPILQFTSSLATLYVLYLSIESNSK